MTDADLDIDGMKALVVAVIEEHDTHTTGGADWCHTCDVEWPCPTLRLCDAITTLLKRVEALEGSYTELLDDEESGVFPCACRSTSDGEQQRTCQHHIIQEQRIAELEAASSELLEVAGLRGDNDLPHPADEAKLWTARMQDAWDALEEVVNGPDMRTRAARSGSEVSDE